MMKISLRSIGILSLLAGFAIAASKSKSKTKRSNSISFPNSDGNGFAEGNDEWWWIFTLKELKQFIIFITPICLRFLISLGCFNAYDIAFYIEVGILIIKAFGILDLAEYNL